MTSAMLAVSIAAWAIKPAYWMLILPAPSIPRLFGMKGPTERQRGQSILSQACGVEVASINLLLDDPGPVVWRGP